MSADANPEASNVEQIGVPVPTIPGLPAEEKRALEDPSTPSTDKAWEEAKSLSQNRTVEELKVEAECNEHGRNQRFKDHFEQLAIIALWIASAGIAGIGAVWAWHLVAPPTWRWLTTEDISHLQSIATTGLLVGVIGTHFRKRLG